MLYCWRMAKKKQLEKKKRRQVRKRDWEHDHDNAFSHDRSKHRHAQVTLREKPASDSSLPTDFTSNGVVISHSKKWAFVQIGEEERLCTIDERLKESDATLLAPGDHVLVELEGDDAIVRGVSPRKSALFRPANAHARVKQQVLAANVDVLIVMAAAADPPFRPGLVDRYLIAAQVCDVTPLLCVNKMDLVDAEPVELNTYRELGIEVFTTSCESGTGVDALRKRLHNTVSVMSGHSGVGKSTLLNKLDANLRVHTQEVMESTGRGKHTTTGSRLYELQNNILIIDTPGIRALGLWQISPEEVGFYFPDIAEASAGCQFRNCTHTHEPKCGVKVAVESGDLHKARYDSYLRIRASLESDTGTTPGRLAAIHSIHE